MFDLDVTLTLTVDLINTIHNDEHSSSVTSTTSSTTSLYLITAIRCSSHKLAEDSLAWRRTEELSFIVMLPQG